MPKNSELTFAMGNEVPFLSDSEVPGDYNPRSSDNKRNVCMKVCAREVFSVQDLFIC